MDTTPSTITVILATRANDLSSFLGVDESGVTWSFDLTSPHHSGAYWFTSSAMDKIVREGQVDFVSRYDSRADRWSVLLGNYGIPSERFTNWREVHRA